jgi:hypothetical protein
LNSGLEVDAKIEDQSRQLNVKMGLSYDQLFRDLDAMNNAIDECVEEFATVKVDFGAIRHVHLCFKISNRSSREIDT